LGGGARFQGAAADLRLSPGGRSAAHLGRSQIPKNTKLRKDVIDKQGTTTSRALVVHSGFYFIGLLKETRDSKGRKFGKADVTCGADSAHSKQCEN